MSSQPEHDDLHPIGVVSRRTGLAQDVIRAWERRYGAVEPHRARDGSRRLYSTEQLERLQLLKRCVDSGWRISEVANRTREELEALVGEATAQREAPAPVPGGKARRDLESLQSESMAAILTLDRERLKAALVEASVLLSAQAFRSELVLPLLERIGELWREGTLRPAHEHLATAIVRSFLETMRAGHSRPGAPRLLVTTPVGQRHELGALMAAAAADELGWQVVYLGPDLPAEEIAAAARQLDVRCVALSLVYVEAASRVLDELSRLRAALPDSVTVLVGGRAVATLRSRLESAGLECPEGLSDFQNRLESLRAPS